MLPPGALAPDAEAPLTPLSVAELTPEEAILDNPGYQGAPRDTAVDYNLDTQYYKGFPKQLAPVMVYYPHDAYYDMMNDWPTSPNRYCQTLQGSRRLGDAVGQDTTDYLPDLTACKKACLSQPDCVAFDFGRTERADGWNKSEKWECETYSSCVEQNDPWGYAVFYKPGYEPAWALGAKPHPPVEAGYLAPGVGYPSERAQQKQPAPIQATFMRKRQ